MKDFEWAFDICNFLSNVMLLISILNQISSFRIKWNLVIEKLGKHSKKRAIAPGNPK